jgi:hypothetical protein
MRTPAGHLLAVFQASQSHEGGATQTKFIVRSADSGATWSSPSVLVAPANETGEVILPWDGTIFLDAAGAARYVFVTSPFQQQSAGDVYTTSSADDGAT